MTVATSRPSISAVVTSKNEAHNIRECLESLAFCEEILLVDSFSDDDTVGIATEFCKTHDDARVVQRPYFGSAAQKNWGMSETRHEWILVLDSDERITPALRDEIEKVMAAGPKVDAYIIRRRCFVLGEELKYSGWQNDSVVRLIRRGTASYPNRRVHADMKTKGVPLELQEPMIHYMVESATEYVDRLVRYGQWGGGQMFREGKLSGFPQLFGRPVWRFFRMYVLQGGFLDGKTGLAFCMIQSYATFLKYFNLWGWRVNEKRGGPVTLPAFDDSEETWSKAEEIQGES